jgi:uncharacterized protein
VKTSLYGMALETFVPMLRNLSAFLDKAAEHARAKGADPDAFVTARLAPDMFPLSFQVQFACDQAKNCVARLMDKEPPKFEDTEQTLADLKARIHKTLDYLTGASAAAFEGAEERIIEMPLQDPMVLKANGLQFLRDWTLPNFYFHVVTAYDILRAQGVPLGKLDYEGPLRTRTASISLL